MENKELSMNDVLAKFSQKKRRRPTVCFPNELSKMDSCELYGYYQKESNYYNITSIGESKMSLGCQDTILLGKYVGEVSEPPINLLENSDKLLGYKYNDSLFFVADGEECEQEPFCLKMDIFSRNTGILESDTMLKKGAIIIGCGSVGSLVALELARAGVGRFFLIDMDIMSYHNICRHQCGVQDVGKFKTTAIKERILQINPTAEVHTENKMIQEIALGAFEDFCNEDCIMIGCADNREGDLYADAMIAKPYKMPFVSIGCWERAFAGEIFYCLPEGMPAYSDFVAALGESSGRTTANTHLYMGEVGTFEPGISVDINFVTTIAIKLILDLLNRDNDGYTQRLIGSLTQYTLICNTNNPKIGGEMAEIFSYPLQVTRSIKVEYAN
jgi:molybdopterin/thiamine biosynthesis adenylyltransferase